MRGMREVYFSTRSKNVAGVLQRYPGLHVSPALGREKWFFGPEACNFGLSGLTDFPGSDFPAKPFILRGKFPFSVRVFSPHR